MSNIPKTRIRALGIEWDKRHREWIFARLAEMYRPKEITQMALTEYAVDWNLGDPKNPLHQERFEDIRRFVHAKIKYYAFNKRNSKTQNRIEELRKEFKKNLADHYREANKFARIRDLSTIKELAMKDKQFMAAVKAVEAIRVEIEGVGPGPSVTVNNNTQVNVRNAPTLADIDRELEQLLTDTGVDRSTAAAFVAGLGSKGTRSLPRPEENVVAPVEGTPGGLPGRAPGLEEGDDSMELPPGVHPA
jgi:hypothetical protein